jgi:hypothetical protein
MEESLDTNDQCFKDRHPGLPLYRLDRCRHNFKYSKKIKSNRLMKLYLIWYQLIIITSGGMREDTIQFPVEGKKMLIIRRRSGISWRHWVDCLTSRSERPCCHYPTCVIFIAPWATTPVVPVSRSSKASLLNYVYHVTTTKIRLQAAYIFLFPRKTACDLNFRV